MRTIGAIVVGVLILTGAIEGSTAWILGIVAIVLLVTSAVSVCPLYALLKVSSRADAGKK
jgi:ABC-type polysaccharide/polyol phosphate export permease